MPPVRSAAPRALVVTIFIALLLHTPLIPTKIFDWLSILFGVQSMEIEEMDGEVLIPLDLDLDPGQTAPPVPTAVATTAPEPEAEPIPAATTKPVKKPEAPKDAGVDASPEDAAVEDAAVEDASVADAAIEDARPDAEGDASTDGGDQDAQAPIASIKDAGGDAGLIAKGPDDAGADAESYPVVASLDDAGADAGPSPTLKDPAATAGAPAEFAGKNPNVSILIAGDRIRKHELGTWFGRILVTIPQWQGFFKDTPIDPIRDLDHVIIAGPQLRDSRKVVAIMDFNVSEKKIHDSIDVIVKRSNPPGKWLEGTPVPAAQAKADNGDRIFALPPGKHMLVVIPADAKAELAKVRGIKPFNKSSAAGIVISLVTPHRAFKGLPIAIPDTLKWMRISVIPTEDGGANVMLEALDGNAALAKEHAEKLGAVIESLRQIDIPFVGKFEIIGPAPFTSDGELIRATSHVTKQQLRLIMSKAEQELIRQAKEAAEAKGGKKNGK